MAPMKKKEKRAEKDINNLQSLSSTSLIEKLVYRENLYQDSAITAVEEVKAKTSSVSVTWKTTSGLT